jgi:hypothetical protein
MKQPWIIGVAASVAMIAAAGLSSCRGEKGETMSSPAKEPSRAMDRSAIERRAHLRLPESVRNLQAHGVEGGIDDAIYLRFEVPTGELPKLVTDAGLTQPLSSTQRFVRNYTGSELAWWQPDSIEPFQSGNLIRDDRSPRYALSLLASNADAPWQTIYVFVTGL